MKIIRPGTKLAENARAFGPNLFRWLRQTEYNLRSIRAAPRAVNSGVSLMMKQNSGFRPGLRAAVSFQPGSGLLIATAIAAGCLASVIGCSDSDDDEPTTETTIGNLAEGDPLPAPPGIPPAAPAAAPLGQPGAPTLNGLEVPEDFLDWRVIGVVDPADATIRVVLGNDIAVDAARAGETNPWPEGSMLGHLQWTEGVNADSAGTIEPTAFAALTVMVKDTEEYAADGGWAYGVWRGADLRPLGDPNFDRACVNCHVSSVPDNDFVFTVPGALPDQEAIDAAEPQLTGIDFPAEVLDWRVIGVANRLDNSSIRVIIGNDTAVAAARSGNINPWPDGTQLAHYVWTSSTNPNIDGAVAPGAFGAITLMSRRGLAAPQDGGWAYGVWSGLDLAPSEDPVFDRACVNCHTDLVLDQDYVFTRPGAMPTLP
jgi:cytochrome P460